MNQHGVAHGIIAAGKKMRELGIPGTFAYHASKGAVIMMTKSAALELSVVVMADEGIASFK